MYCSTCGGTITQGLGYCKHCGAKLFRDDSLDPSSELKPGSLIFGMLATFVFGMVAITLLMGMMRVVLGLPVGQVLALTLLPFSILLVLEVVFIRLLLRQTEGRKTISEVDLARPQVTNELDAAKAYALPEVRQSVTEHTTRAFEPIRTKVTGATNE